MKPEHQNEFKIQDLEDFFIMDKATSYDNSVTAFAVNG